MLAYALYTKIKKLYCYKHGKKYRDQCVVIYRSSKDKAVQWGGNNKCGKNTVLNYSSVGKMTYLGDDCFLTYCSIGKFDSIGDRVKVIAGNHPTSRFVSTHPAFYSKNYMFSFVNRQKYDEHSYFDNIRKTKVYIGNDVWIGSDVRILEGVRIGDGAVIAAGAVVVNDIEPFTIVGGVPAREIKKRFSLVQIDYLLHRKWWNDDLDKICAMADCFDNIEDYIKCNKV
jgi:acetyltransferase-like isoleucine patch superfamily enzyme